MKGPRSGMGIAVLAIVSFLFVITGTTAVAGEQEPHYYASGFGDLYTGGMAGVDMNFVVGDDITGYVPAFMVQYGIGNIAFGLQWGLAYGDPDLPPEYDYDGEIAPGNIILNFKAKHCMPGAWRTCMGANFSLGIGPFESDDKNALSFMSGLFAHTVRMLHYYPEAIVIDPLFALNTTNGMVFVQIALGPSIQVPIDDTDRRDAEAGLAYGFEVGARLQDFLSMGLGFKGISTLTYDENESYFSLDINVRVVFSGVSPGIRLSIPFTSDDFIDEFFDMVVTLGVVGDF